jgi:hypothetical protein
MAHSGCDALGEHLPAAVESSKADNRRLIGFEARTISRVTILVKRAFAEKCRRRSGWAGRFWKRTLRPPETWPILDSFRIARHPRGTDRDHFALWRLPTFLDYFTSRRT